MQQLCIDTLSETLRFSSCLSKAHFPNALIGQLTHAWASITHPVSSRVCRLFSLHLPHLFIFLYMYVRDQEKEI